MIATPAKATTFCDSRAATGRRKTADGTNDHGGRQVRPGWRMQGPREGVERIGLAWVIAFALKKLKSRAPVSCRFCGRNASYHRLTRPNPSERPRALRVASG